MGDVALDSSVIIAILKHEAEAPSIMDAIDEADELFMSSVNYMETGIVWDNQIGKTNEPQHLDLLLNKLSVTIIPTNFELAHEARAAYRKFGKGNHKAALNMGDCFAYALAKSMKIPLLYKGGDFNLTDVKKIA
ncbi:MAG: type II toxin-antitoxin system VapC family toxin [Alphaproteobacteria bacterium]|nr:type II toxin-antitoxin system VapC family toxin [Alphaproteobacteria bacterium]